MNFASDNTTIVAPEILAAIERANQGQAMPYGNDEITARLADRFAEVFETEVAVFPVAMGSAANSLGLATMTPPWGAIYCHEESHINMDECGAPEFYTGGAKLVAMAGAEGKLQAADLAERLGRAGTGVVHHVQPAAVSLTQSTEAGTVYTPDEIGAIAALCRAHTLGLQMDGARFANAVAALDCAPADITWRAGVDVLAFGATKNGAMAAEAVVFFRKDLAADFEFRRKRAGHLFSKMRFVSAQLEAYLADGLWLKNAAHANAMARRLADGLGAVEGARLLHPVEANEIFVALPEPVIRGLEGDGFLFYRWEGEGSTTLRLVTAFSSRQEDVDAFAAAARRHAAA
ncbi:MAG: low specificity L-threonine aldolase, partial [Alphaproteobacteria bacterium]|nr:low specificity L-threonine aldolase [Alphaproteobacteria bacterium]